MFDGHSNIDGVAFAGIQMEVHKEKAFENLKLCFGAAYFFFLHELKGLERWGR